MLFIGYFSFNAEDEDGSPRYGNFECIVDADNPEAASEKFEQHLIEERSPGEIFDHPKIRIFLDQILGVHEELKDATVAHYKECDGESPLSVHGILPTKNSEACKSYEWQPDEISDEEFDKLTEEGYTSDPFLEFE